MYAQNTFNEVLGWYGLCASSTFSSTLTTTTGQIVVSPCTAGSTTTTTSHDDDADPQLTGADHPLDLTCSTAALAAAAALSCQ